jgi:hypothetical protein
VKPSEDVALMAGLLTDMLLGQPCSLAPEPAQLAPPGVIPATVIYCVSKAEVETMRSVMNTDARLRGRVRVSRRRRCSCNAPDHAQLAHLVRATATVYWRLFARPDTTICCSILP